MAGKWSECEKKSLYECHLCENAMSFADLLRGARAVRVYDV